MKADAHTPAQIFGNQIRYVVPLYQRPYVWSKDDQWQPLWDDVRTLAERVLTAPAVYGAPPVSPHFLGAIVIDQLPSAVTHIGARAVIDGQQRLTTLQLLLDAAQEVVARHGRPYDAEALRDLVLNKAAIALDPDHVFKVWPTDRDRDAFRAAMSDHATPTSDQSRTKIAQAHAFFVDAINAWLAEDGEGAENRLAALTLALRDHLRMVVIDLEPGDNAQVIFETLNHRGAPLLAADLIKNLVFQLAESQGRDTQKLYDEYWRELDGDYWRQMVAQGRLYRPRIDVFMHRWLVMKLLREVPVDRVFTEFRDHVAFVPDADVEEVLAELAADAAVHRSWDGLPVGSAAERFHYRVLNAMDTKVVAPVFLWLTRHPATEMPNAQRDKALGAVESWLIRRMLARVTSKDYNNAAIDLLRALVEAGPSVAGDTAESFLASANAESRFWPDDERVRSNLTDDRVYQTMTRARLRMLLEVLEDHARTDLGEGQPAPRGLTIEHVMPRAWKEYWATSLPADPDEAAERDGLVHTLGNLSLVTGKLNPTLSNRPWTDQQAKAVNAGNKGKREYLLQHSNLKLNAALIMENPDGWTDEDIRSRTAVLIETLLRRWPVPSTAAQPGGVVSSVLEDSAPALSVEESDGWSTSDSALQDARMLWESISPVARDVLDTLCSVAPEAVGADDLAERVALGSGRRGVSGVLSGIARVAETLDRPSPVAWQEGEPSIYWVTEVVAQTLEAAKPGDGTKAVPLEVGSMERPDVATILHEAAERARVAGNSGVAAGHVDPGALEVLLHDALEYLRSRPSVPSPVGEGWTRVAASQSGLMPHWVELTGWDTDEEKVPFRPLRAEVFDLLEQRGDIVKPPGQGMPIDVSPALSLRVGSAAQAPRPRDTSGPRVRTRHEVTGSILPLIEAGLVKPGDELLHDQIRTGVRVRASVTAGGRIETSAGTFDAPSPALRALVGYEVNGWQEWTHVPTGELLSSLRSRLREDPIRADRGRPD